jgi:16S rRNA (uracil1498-N3)-methyltransferase
VRVSDVLRRAAAHLVVDDLAAPVLDEEAQHHLFRVLRLRDGEVVTVTDGAGSWRACRVRGGHVEPDGEVAFVPRRASPITIAFAVPKHDRPEWIVQKLTELGVDRVVVLEADRSVVRWSHDRARKNTARFRRIALEAAHQCRAVWLPVIEGPIDAAVLLSDAVVAEPGGRAMTAADRVIAIGPEGGWSERELAGARDRITLGESVLRVETAAITAGVRAIGFDPGV